MSKQIECALVADCGHIKKRAKCFTNIRWSFAPFAHIKTCTYFYCYIWSFDGWLEHYFFRCCYFLFHSFFCSAQLFCFADFWFLMFQHQSYLFNGFCANKHISLYHVSRFEVKQRAHKENNDRDYSLWRIRWTILVDKMSTHVQTYRKLVLILFSSSCPHPPASFNSFLCHAVPFDIFVIRISYVWYWFFFELTLFFFFSTCKMV